MPADPEDRERLAREVAEEITNALVPPFRGMSLIARQHLVEKVAQRVAAAFERVREPLEKELEEWRGLQPTFKAAMERLSSEFQQLEADADSLRSQLSEAQQRVERLETALRRAMEHLDCWRHRPNADWDCRLHNRCPACSVHILAEAALAVDGVASGREK